MRNKSSQQTDLAHNLAGKKKKPTDCYPDISMIKNIMLNRNLTIKNKRTFTSLFLITIVI